MTRKYSALPAAIAIRGSGRQPRATAGNRGRFLLNRSEEKRRWRTHTHCRALASAGGYEPVPEKTTPMVRKMILKSSQMLQLSM